MFRPISLRPCALVAIILFYGRGSIEGEKFSSGDCTSLWIGDMYTCNNGQLVTPRDPVHRGSSLLQPGAMTTRRNVVPHIWDP